MQALWLALDAPARVRSVVAIGTPAIAFGARVETYASWHARPRAADALTADAPVRVSEHPGRDHGTRRGACLSGARARHVSGRPPRGVRRDGLKLFTGDVPRGGRRTSQVRAFGRRAQCIAQPVLAIWGKDDTHFQPIEEAKARAALMPRSCFEVVSGGHEPWLDDLEACTRLISAFHSG